MWLCLIPPQPKTKGSSFPTFLCACHNITDVLSNMFSHALNYNILFGVPVGDFASMCNVHYTSDLLVLTIGGMEDLRVIKLILYLFEGVSRLTINFSKTCHYSTRVDQLLDADCALTLYCSTGLPPLKLFGGSNIHKKKKPQESGLGKADLEGQISPLHLEVDISFTRCPPHTS